MTLSSRRPAAILAGVLCTFAGLLRADDPAPIDAEAEQQSATEATSREAGRVQFRTEGSGADLDPSADSILKWSNPDVGRVYGNVYLWTEEGRPVVATSVYQWFYPYQDLTLEFCSLSERLVQGRYDDETVWDVQQSGVTWRDLGGDAPGASRPLRLIQMKRAAERFTARLQDERTGDDVAKVLRPLATPLYRYPARGAVLDGALFAFVVGTDPELLLLIEAEGERWRYAVARMNRDALQVSLDDQVVESYEHLADEMFDLHKPYFLMNARPSEQTSAAPQRRQLIEEAP
jgi:hypothetical protein